MCHGFELEEWKRAMEQSQQTKKADKPEKQGGTAAASQPEKPAKQPEPVPV